MSPSHELLLADPGRDERRYAAERALLVDEACQLLLVRHEAIVRRR
ncbi:MAG: hypothetical protein ACR2GT_09945 [Gaiellaceae bacterium]